MPPSDTLPAAFSGGRGWNTNVGGPATVLITPTMLRTVPGDEFGGDQELGKEL